MLFTSLLSLSLAASAVSAYSIPPALQTFYNGVKNGGCKSYLKNRSNLNDGQGHSGFGFCTDTPGALYVSGPGELADMDIDCDGARNCGSGDFQPQTSFDDILQSKGYGINNLDASKHTFVVLGTCDVPVDRISGGPIEPLSVIAIVCNNQLHYGVYGDTNGCDDNNFTGEASLSLGQICFPNEGLNGDNGHTGHDVLYLAFTGTEAVPGPNGANWKTSDPKVFEASIKALGDKMIAKVLGGSTPGPTTTSPTPSPTGSCSWTGHCSGAPCSTDNDCDGALTCVSGKCGGSTPKPTTTPKPTPTPTCSWAGHCAGAACSTDDDCSDALTCQSGKCHA
ncbi:fungal chitosanase of glycosyl hydrolase group 75-domain-containing protein [Pyronema domesticum]|nr:fungal chitosanase of glycosyl hydrolase group 75-domain-containing protein [Pyronema domesticum]